MFGLRRSFISLLLLLVGLLNTAVATEIVWVREVHFADQNEEWIEFFTDNGHTVDERDLRDLDDATARELDNAALIIFSRDSNSGDYNNSPEERAAWNSISAPMIVMTPYVLRSSRWMMVNSTTITDTSGTLEAVIPEHPLFAGDVLDEFNQVEMWDDEKFGPDDNIDLIGAADLGNGSLIALQPETDLVWAALWEPGVEFYDGSGEFAGGARLFLSGGSDDDPNSWGGKNYTSAADQILLNAIEFMAPSALPGAPGDFNVDGVIDLTDFSIMTTNFNQRFARGESYVAGDLNLDTRVDLSDFLEFRELFIANQANGGAAAVPEPTGLMLVLLPWTVLATRRRHRQ